LEKARERNFKSSLLNPFDFSISFGEKLSKKLQQKPTKNRTIKQSTQHKKLIKKAQSI
jgi:hypothetical protein